VPLCVRVEQPLCAELQARRRRAHVRSKISCNGDGPRAAITPPSPAT
jgi:hypothetical protein